MLDHLVPPPPGIAFPQGAEIVVLEAADGVKLRAAFFKPERHRGTVFVLQGRTEFLEKYGETFQSLLDRHFAIAAIDWRGQGGSDRQLRDPRKGHVEDFDDYLLDLDALMAEAKNRAMPEPYGILAHSTGGAVALLELGRGKHTFSRAVLTSPLVEIARVRWKTGARFLARFLTSIGFSGFFIPKGGPDSIFEKPFADNPLTRDEKRHAIAAHWVKTYPEIGIGDPTIGWVDAAFEALATFETPGFGSENHTPLLMLLAGADTVVSSNAAAELAARMRGASAIRLPGARHEILMETDATLAAFWPAFDAFMQLGDVNVEPSPEIQPEETHPEAAPPG